MTLIPTPRFPAGPGSVLITGGTSGIGLAAARLLAEHGWRVGVLGRDPLRCATVAARLPGAVPVPAEVRDPAAVRAAVDGFAAGGLDAVVAAAGIGDCRGIAELDATEWQDMVAVNLSGTFHVLHAAYPHWRRARRGHAVVIGSLASGGTWHRELAYGTVKAAQVKLVQHLGDQFRADAETDGGAYAWHAVCPGTVDTPFWNRIPERTIDRTEALAADRVAAVVADCLAHPALDAERLAERHAGPAVVVGRLAPWLHEPRIVRIAAAAHP
ncbi:MAG: hypothetical protein RLZZ127_563 [Planctomycetota bacterium]|jgi:NAD(P)-dependent dehydrogenase (short-subunit alcohol dehydrogenase family)